MKVLTRQDAEVWEAEATAIEAIIHTHTTPETPIATYVRNRGRSARLQRAASIHYVARHTLPVIPR